MSRRPTRTVSRAFSIACTCTCATVLVAGPARAQDRPPAARDTLGAVMITATRVAVATVAPTVTVTVLQGESLRAQGITHVLDALRLVPGASVVASGPVGSQTSLFLRGGNSNYVRVLVDGVAVNDAGGGFDLASLSTGNIDRIEVVRGPTSVLYGSDAVTGVVQVFTRDGRGAFSAHALAGAGSHGARRGTLGASRGGARAGFSLEGASELTDGILPFNNKFVNHALSASVRADPDSRTDARVAARWSSATYHYPTDFSGAVVDHNAEQTDHRLTLSAEAGRRLGERIELRVLLTSNEFLPRSNDGPDSPADTLDFYGFYSRAVRTHRAADARLNLRTRRGVLTVGVDVARDRERSSSLSLSQYGMDAGGFEAARHSTGFFAQVIGDATDRVSFALGGRADRNSAFGSFQTVRASVAHVLSSSARARVSVGSAFKAPSFFENFSTGFATGNPTLRPERSRSAEVGVDAFLAGGTLTMRMTVYRQQFRDVIQYTGTPPSPGAPNYFNVAAADANGVEVEAEYDGIDRLALAATYAFTDTRTTRSGFDRGTGAIYVVGERLIRRPPHMMTLSAACLVGSSGRVHLVASRIGDRDDRDFTAYPPAAVRLGAYTKVDLSADIAFPEGFARGTALVVRFDNLFDARYEEVSGFPAPGRSVFVGVRAGR